MGPWGHKLHFSWAYIRSKGLNRTSLISSVCVVERAVNPLPFRCSNSIVCVGPAVLATLRGIPPPQSMLHCGVPSCGGSSHVPVRGWCTLSSGSQQHVYCWGVGGGGGWYPCYVGPSLASGSLATAEQFGGFPFSLGFAILDQNNFGWNELCLKVLRCHRQCAKVVLFVKWPSSKSAKLICVLSIQSSASSLCDLNL